LETSDSKKSYNAGRATAILAKDFGPWQQIFYGEFDGQRRKRVVVKVMGE